MERTQEELEQLAREIVALNTPDQPSANSRCSDAAGSRLFRAAQKLFQRENEKDEVAMWNFIVAGRDLPEEPAGLRVQKWIAKRWGYDVAQDYGTVPPLHSENSPVLTRSKAES